MTNKFYNAILFLVFVTYGFSQQKTFCNPINIDYGYTPIPNLYAQGKHRATADPVIVNFKGKYFLFSTNQWGYWWSTDMLHWNFVSRKFSKFFIENHIQSENDRKQTRWFW